MIIKMMLMIKMMMMIKFDDDDRNDVASNEVPTTSTCQLKLEGSPNDTEES